VDAVPSDRPAVIVADGLMGLLTLEDVVALLNRITDRFPSGETAFNSCPEFAIWAVKHTRGTRSVADLITFPGSDDPHEPERWNPHLMVAQGHRGPPLPLLTGCSHCRDGARRHGAGHDVPT
jgi:O-methyltransferase involved in polyketide biosynthesis